MFLIFPHQLFYNIEHLSKDEQIYLIEEPRYFTDFKYHKLKLAYHRASMKAYFDYLIKNDYNVKYVEFDKITNDFYKLLNKKSNQIISYIEVNDHKLQTKLSKIVNPIIIPNKNFLISTVEFDDIKKLIYRTKSKRYHHDIFYVYQRIKLNILIDSNNKPIGNRWSFDKENRKKPPKNYKISKPTNKTNLTNQLTLAYISESIEYVNIHFKDNYGDLSLDNFIYPIDNKSANKWLKYFLKHRLKNYGAYQDYISSDDDFVYHSILSPMMNIGILVDSEVVKISYKFYLKNKSTIELSSFEGFIRQIIGWRNYVYFLYMTEGQHICNQNQLKHKNKLNYKAMWEGTTNILPIDNIIKKIVKYSYAHHIERLMVLGNFLLLMMINPNDVYQIFMEWTIDAYDWVMVPNVYGMSQFATPMMMNRPYFSSSNYILKMSNYKKDKWCSIIDALYYNFINKHQNILRKNYSTAYQVILYNKKSSADKLIFKKTAQTYIKQFSKN